MIDFQLTDEQEQMRQLAHRFAEREIRFMLADTATEIDAARLLTWRAAWRADRGLPCNVQASMPKVYATDIAMRVTTDAVAMENQGR